MFRRGKLFSIVLIIVFVCIQKVTVHALPSGNSTEEEAEKVVCNSEEVLCDDGTFCYLKYSECDGMNDCDDGTDEKDSICNAPDYDCGEGRFKCKTGGRCIDDISVCNKSPQCSDGSDESNETCATRKDWCTSSPLWVRCSDVKECISIYWICDGTTQCDDGWDEQNCTKPCGQYGHLCADGKQCVSVLGLCDGLRDCMDRSDEDKAFCANRTCPEEMFTCKSGNGQCVPQGLVCDGAEDCKDGSDEHCRSIAYTLWEWGSSLFNFE